jgi:hypothetical protein
MIEEFSLGNDPQLVDVTARLYREGKATLLRNVAAILDGFGSTVDHRQTWLEKLRRSHLGRRVFATSRPRLRAVAERLGLRQVPNLGGCLAS